MPRTPIVHTRECETFRAPAYLVRLARAFSHLPPFPNRNVLLGKSVMWRKVDGRLIEKPADWVPHKASWREQMEFA